MIEPWQQHLAISASAAYPARAVYIHAAHMCHDVITATGIHSQPQVEGGAESPASAIGPLLKADAS